MTKLKVRFRELLIKKYGDELPSQDAIAADLKVSQTTVSRWLAGNINRFDSETIINICENLPCTPGELFYIEETA